MSAGAADLRETWKWCVCCSWGGHHLVSSGDQRLLRRIDAIFRPRSVAVVGASANPDTPGYDYVASMQEFGFRGAIYPVNPKGGEILGLPVAKSLAEVPGDVDYVISCIPSRLHPRPRARQAAQRNVKAMQLFTGRFSETGREEDIALEHKLREAIEAAGIRLIGPNCMGVLNPAHGMSFRRDMSHAGGRRRLPLAERQPALRDHPLRRAARPALLEGGQLRQRARPRRDRLHRVLRARPRDEGHRRVRRRRARRPALPRRAEAGLGEEAGRRAEGRPDERRRTRRRLAHGGAGRREPRLGGRAHAVRRARRGHRRGPDRHADRVLLHA